MDSLAPDRLTECQKVILRLIHQGHESKDIAAALGLSPHTIDGHVRDAMRSLGVSRRKQAARLLAQAELADPQPLTAQSLAVSEAEVRVLPEPLAATGWSGDNDDEQQVMQERLPPPQPNVLLDEGRAVGRRNKLTIPQRLRRIARLATTVATIFATIAFAMFLMERLVQVLRSAGY